MGENIQWIPYNDFSGGENVDADPDNLKDNEVMVGENVDFNIAGGFKTRLGCVPLNETRYEATGEPLQVEQVFEWKKSNGTVQLMAVVGQTLYKVDDTDGTLTEVQLLGGAGKIPYSAFQDKLYFIDWQGVEYYNYNGTACTAVTPAVGADLSFVKKCKFMVWHNKSYRWLFAGNTDDKIAVAYSEANEPDNVKALSVLYPIEGIGEILGLKSYGGAILPFYRYSARIWRGVDPDVDLEWGEVPIPEGALSNDAITLTPGSLTYLGKGGWWMMPPAILNYNVTMQTANDLVPNLAFGKQTKNIRAITRPDLACSVYDPNTGLSLLAYTKTTGESRNSRVMVNLWGTRCFWHYTGWQVNDWCLRSNGDLLYGGNGYIYKVRYGTNDNGAAINQRVECKKVNLGYPNYHKTVGKALIKSGPHSTKSTADIKIKSASSSVLKTNVELKTSRKWTDPWNSPWGSRDSVLTEVNFDPALTGQEFQFVYSNNRLNEAMLIYGHSYGMKVKQPTGKKVP
jgi:hypothetical protein